MSGASAGVCPAGGTTAAAASSLESCGGRVLAVTGVGNTLQEAVQAAYAGMGAVHFAGMHYRTDIAKRYSTVVEWVWIVAYMVLLSCLYYIVSELRFLLIIILQGPQQAAAHRRARIN